MAAAVVEAVVAAVDGVEVGEDVSDDMDGCGTDSVAVSTGVEGGNGDGCWDIERTSGEAEVDVDCSTGCGVVAATVAVGVAVGVVVGGLSADCRKVEAMVGLNCV